VASEIWVADTPSLTPYKTRGRSVSSALLGHQIDAISDTDSNKSPKCGFDLTSHIENAVDQMAVSGSGAEGEEASEATPSLSGMQSQSERGTHTPRDHSQVRKLKSNLSDLVKSNQVKS
jgi:hypothetical protein